MVIKMKTEKIIVDPDDFAKFMKKECKKKGIDVPIEVKDDVVYIGVTPDEIKESKQKEKGD